MPHPRTHGAAEGCVVVALTSGVGWVAVQEGLTPLMFAAANNPHAGVVRALLEAGADINAKDYVSRPAVLVGGRLSLIHI